MCLRPIPAFVWVWVRVDVSQNHEIRTPLVGVVGVTDILLATAGVKGDLREQLGIIHSSGKALLTLVNNILDISRMDAHMLTVNRQVRVHAVQTESVRTSTRAMLKAGASHIRARIQPEDIRSITRTVTDTFVAIAAAKGIAFSAIIGDKVPTLLLLDATRIQQLIGNLLGTIQRAGTGACSGASAGTESGWVRELFPNPADGRSHARFYISLHADRERLQVYVERHRDGHGRSHERRQRRRIGSALAIRL